MQRWASLVALVVGSWLLAGSPGAAHGPEDGSQGEAWGEETFPPGLSDSHSPMLAPGDAWNATFPVFIGTYLFHCMPHHALMTGEVVVEEGAPMEADVRIVDFGFEPRETHVAPGATVRWTNHGEEEHDVIVHAYDPPGEERRSPAPAALLGLSAVALAVVLRGRRAVR